MFGRTYGYIDKKGNVVIRPQFELAFDFSDGLARVKFNGEWAFIDKRGQIVFVAPFDYADDFQGGYAMVAKRPGTTKPRFEACELKVSYIGKDGKLTSIGWYNVASRFSEALAFVSKDPNITSCFSQGGVITDILDSFADVAGTFPKHVSYSFINADGESIFEGTYENVKEFAEHRAAVRVKDKWGYVNELGEMIIPPQFDCADPFSEGLAHVCVKEERYFIDTSGRIVFRHDADLMTPFTNGLALLMSCNVLPCRSFYVDKQGRVVWQGVFRNTN
jgi:hypothetical protein